MSAGRSRPSRRRVGSCEFSGKDLLSFDDLEIRLDAIEPIAKAARNSLTKIRLIAATQPALLNVGRV